jgi:UDP-sulfoquinovose synthase
VSDVRTAITYTTETEETAADERLATRFDFDYYFGVVSHRFCAQAVAEYPLTVYGKGEQRKPFISLEDAVEGLARLALNDVDERPDDHVVYNQVTRAISIVEIAETIAEVAQEHGLDTAVTHVENPRDEDEEHAMEIENERYMDLIGDQRVDFEGGVRDAVSSLVEYQDVVKAHEDRFLPGALQEDVE